MSKVPKSRTIILVLVCTITSGIGTAQVTDRHWGYVPVVPTIGQEFKVVLPEQMNPQTRQAYGVVTDFLERVKQRKSIKDLLAPPYDVMVQNQVLEAEQLFLSWQMHYIIGTHRVSPQELEISVILWGRPEEQQVVFYLQGPDSWKIVDVVVSPLK